MEEKIVIIGVGFIGGYLETGLRLLLGAQMPGRVFGIKGHAAGLARRQRELPDYILSVNDTKDVLLREQPTIIVLSAPPEASAHIAQTILVPYYESLRRHGCILPDLYSFTPSPSAAWYEKLLGEDISIAKILPNIYPSCQDMDITPLGINTVSLARPWPKERFTLLKRILSPYGTTVALTDAQALVFLAGKITSHVCLDLCLSLRKAMKTAGYPISLNDLGSALRLAQQDITPGLPALAPCSDKALPPQIRPFIKALARAWFEGLCAFTQSQRLPLSKETILELDAKSFALNIFPIAYETEEQLKKDTKNAATKGGVLERGMEYFQDHIKGRLTAAAIEAAGGKETPEAFFSWLAQESFHVSQAAYERSCHLAGRSGF